MLEEERRRREELEALLRQAKDDMEQVKKALDAERKKSLDLSNQLQRLQDDGKKETVREIQQATSSMESRGIRPMNHESDAWSRNHES